MTAAVATKLREARSFVERGWTQGDWAKDAEGEPRVESEPEAVCWCAGGAMFRAAGEGVRVHQLYDVFEHAIGNSVTSWNDAPDRTQAEVLAAFDRAIEIAERAQ